MMKSSDLLKALEFDDSPHFLSTEDQYHQVPDYAHTFRKAAADCSLTGVYVLHQPSTANNASVVPVAYVCTAKTEDEARKIHRLVWNQNIVPFLVVQSPQFVRLYSGFRYDHESKTEGTLAEVSELSCAADALKISAGLIDDGTIWELWGGKITPETRVDWRLLENLRALGEWLRQNGLDRMSSHALIGKFVYLSYLKDREILSDRKLNRWGMNPKDVFGRGALLPSFWALMEKLDEWLNGSVFPFGEQELPPSRRHTCRKWLLSSQAMIL